MRFTSGPGMYGSGLADRLFEWLIGPSAACMRVLEGNPRAWWAYYRKVGFRADGHTKA